MRQAQAALHASVSKHEHAVGLWLFGHAGNAIKSLAAVLS